MSIEVRNITHIYSEGLPHESKALEGVSFDVADGEFVGIIGHTGSGKSTLVQHLNGLLKPKSGTITVGGKEITAEGVSMVEIRKKIGLVFQYPEYQLFEETVEKDVSFGLKNLNLPEEEVEEAARKAIELVGLDYEEVKNKSPFELSGGQKRKAAIAGVIAMEPEVLILDEPTAGLDPKAHGEILRMIQEVHKKENNIIILISHNMNDIARLSDKILVMEQGRLVMSGTPREVFAREEMLSAMGLELPELAKLARDLRKRGIDIGNGIFTIDRMEEAIVRAFAAEAAEGEEK